VLGSEVGFDMSPWETEKHFTSWLGLCPGTKITGGKRISRKTKRTKNRAAQAFRMAAASLARNRSALGAYYRRIKARKGGIHAVTATAHKLARIFYAMLKNRKQYVELGQQAYEEKYRTRRIASLLKQAKSLGFNLTPCEG
jgi:transposase